jgi:hypothetical protein
MEYSGAGGKLIHEKTRSKKSRDTVPLKDTQYSSFDGTVTPFHRIRLILLRQTALNLNSLLVSCKIQILLNIWWPMPLFYFTYRYRYNIEVDEEKVHTYNISVGVCLWFCPNNPARQ